MINNVSNLPLALFIEVILQQHESTRELNIIFVSLFIWEGSVVLLIIMLYIYICLGCLLAIFCFSSRQSKNNKLFLSNMSYFELSELYLWLQNFTLVIEIEATEKLQGVNVEFGNLFLYPNDLITSFCCACARCTWVVWSVCLTVILPLPFLSLSLLCWAQSLGCLFK